ncbi:hypothetical protein GTA08_BOTSDO00564 [Botryosphaeria dothidea]|uniref:Uncharacterized protein n=1 Tax=Botryosphaeria dothidea TaxID=55169 RepID=A0A8H4J803_9PEZI|nr:hypothetical protein GTA08_BOTSDO00564 [Botryosphaeria dothidea]
MANTTSTTPTSDNAFLHRKRVLGDESLEQLTPTLMGLPVEIRQQILSLVRDALYPWDQVILNPSSRHAAHAAARTRPLYNISRTIRAEMVYVGNSWLKQFPMHLAAFEKYVRKPERVNGVLTLVLFDEDFFEYPPAEWREEVQRYSYLFDRIEHSWETDGAAQKGYMNVWNGLIKGLPRRGAKKLGIKAVEMLGIDADENLVDDEVGFG